MFGFVNDIDNVDETQPGVIEKEFLRDRSGGKPSWERPNSAVDNVACSLRLACMQIATY